MTAQRLTNFTMTLHIGNNGKNLSKIYQITANSIKFFNMTENNGKKKLNWYYTNDVTRCTGKHLV